MSGWTYYAPFSLGTRITHHFRLARWALLPHTALVCPVCRVGQYGHTYLHRCSLFLQASCFNLA
jgi:hypothetical protein